MAIPDLFVRQSQRHQVHLSTSATSTNPYDTPPDIDREPLPCRRDSYSWQRRHYSSHPSYRDKTTWLDKRSLPSPSLQKFKCTEPTSLFLASVFKTISFQYFTVHTPCSHKLLLLLSLLLRPHHPSRPFLCHGIILYLRSLPHSDYMENSWNLHE